MIVRFATGLQEIGPLILLFTDFDFDALFDFASSSVPQVPNSQEVPMNSIDETVPIPSNTHGEQEQDIFPTNEKHEVLIRSTVKQFGKYFR
jgi:hypothetical protein